ncbi:hypothetical protein N0X72_20850 [Streptomyces carpaticus]|uniref:hypothetical protein n=1 Tax=Streptomyces TaxID=1883 RepID=UPI001591BA36|nr:MULTISPECIES: hypothetical protein [Streptomyces]MCK1815537.1 hypothetical protein [Streptomyces sp. XM4011]QKV70811.1 hypothetical protein HUT13_20115 [Streptomyces harbinensis]UWM51248.1 hypothetical protein N0X72_20850 [Streptomyces carpaticus]
MTPVPRLPDLIHADDRPVPPRLGDGADWVLGRCWLWCANRYTWVLWLGPASTTGHHASLYACESCVDRLHHTIIDYSEAMADAPTDATGIRVPLYLSPKDPPRPGPLFYRQARHRRPRTVLGRLWHRLITGRDAPPSR